ncbi:hypothetical protein KC336_g38 [Hortaea werneckii]|nr:hypothetical protein KC336_g38 [Hortaea werneckii]
MSIDAGDVEEDVVVRWIWKTRVPRLPLSRRQTTTSLSPSSGTHFCFRTITWKCRSCGGAAAEGPATSVTLMRTNLSLLRPAVHNRLRA